MHWISHKMHEISTSSPKVAGASLLPKKYREIPAPDAVDYGLSVNRPHSHYIVFF